MEKIKEWIALRLTKNKNDVWSFQESFKGRYKNFKVDISSGTDEAFSRRKDYYYYYVRSLENPNIAFNSLWAENGKFKDAADAHDAVVQWIDNKVKELKKK